MVRQLIVTADDFGLGPGVNRAVVEAHEAGVLTCASLMVTHPGFEEAVGLARSMPSLDVGFHFVLAAGRPVSRPEDVPSLVRPDGAFLARHRLLLRALTGRLRSDDVGRELRAQLERLTRAGVRPSYVNGDQHVHILPVVRDVVLDTACDLRLAVRVPREERVWKRSGAAASGWGLAAPRLAVKTALDALAGSFARRCRELSVSTNDRFLSPFGHFPSPRFDIEGFEALFEHFRDGVTELMVHPAYADQATADFWTGGEAQARDREAELTALLDPRFARALQGAGASLTTYASALGTPGSEVGA